MTTDSNLYGKTGYLNSEFKLFHIIDHTTREFEFHYHDFYKILILIQGDITYLIEGKSYRLKPYDIVLVNRNDIHRPVINSTIPYERIVVYISPGFIDSYKTSEYDLSDCFRKAQKERSNVLRIPSPKNSTLFHTITRLEKSFHDQEFAADLYRQLLFLEVMIQMNRAASHDSLEFIDMEESNSKILDILHYINSHLAIDLAIDDLAAHFYLSKYHMMRSFKSETGYTIGNYITEKRLLLARELIKKQTPITQACFDCGFKDYSTFSRAYRKFFHEAPRDCKTSPDSDC